MGFHVARGGSGRGSFVVLVGPDGVGKTTVAAEMIRRFDGCTGYVHFRPPFWSKLAVSPDTSVPGRGKQFVEGSGWMGVLRITWSLVRFWTGYLRRVWPMVRNGCLVVADRWGYGYLAQSAALGFHGPEWLADVVVRLLPRPDLAVALQAPVEVILSRKAELTADQIREELSAYESLPLSRLVIMDSTLEPGEIAEAVLAQLRSEKV